MIKRLMSSLSRQRGNRVFPFKLHLNEIATTQNFNEAAYLAANPDVRAAVKSGTLKSGRVHFRAHGLKERRGLRLSPPIQEIRNRKMERLRPLLRSDLPVTWTSTKP